MFSGFGGFVLFDFEKDTNCFASDFRLIFETFSGDKHGENLGEGNSLKISSWHNCFFFFNAGVRFYKSPY